MSLVSLLDITATTALFISDYVWQVTHTPCTHWRQITHWHVWMCVCTHKHIYLNQLEKRERGRGRCSWWDKNADKNEMTSQLKYHKPAYHLNARHAPTACYPFLSFIASTAVMCRYASLYVHVYMFHQVDWLIQLGKSNSIKPQLSISWRGRSRGFRSKAYYLLLRNGKLICFYENSQSTITNVIVFEVICGKKRSWWPQNGCNVSVCVVVKQISCTIELFVFCSHWGASGRRVMSVGENQMATRKLAHTPIQTYVHIFLSLQNKSTTGVYSHQHLHTFINSHNALLVIILHPFPSVNVRLIFLLESNE